ncbi:alpha/beta fold hydrolase [Rhodoflexus sp.]
METQVLHFRELGEHNRANGTLFIFHGLFGLLDNWQTVAKTLAEAYHVILADMRNHGRSFRADSLRYTDMATDMVQLIDFVQPLQATAIGHSMGGKAAMQLAADFPDKLSRLVVVDIAPRAYPVHHQSILDGLNAVPLATLQSRQEAENILSQYGMDTGTRQFLLKNLYRTEDNRFGWRFNLPVITKQIAEVGQPLSYRHPIAIPTLFIRGSRSGYITDADAAQIPAIFPNSRLVTIANAGHWVHAEQPTALLEALLSFLKTYEN